jgi:hypothetical protein
VSLLHNCDVKGGIHTTKYSQHFAIMSIRWPTLSFLLGYLTNYSSKQIIMLKCSPNWEKMNSELSNLKQLMIVQSRNCECCFFKKYYINYVFEPKWIINYRYFYMIIHYQQYSFFSHTRILHPPNNIGFVLNAQIVYDLYISHLNTTYTTRAIAHFNTANISM